MATMAVVSPITNFSSPASTSHISSAKSSYCVTSRDSLRCFKRVSGGLVHLSSSGRVLTSVRLKSNITRLEPCTCIEPQLTADESTYKLRCTDLREWFTSCREPSDSSSRHGRSMVKGFFSCNCTSHESQDTVDKEDTIEDVDEPSVGVAIAVKILQFYKREISPLLPGSCRFVPTCSEYGMQAFKKYGVVKGTVLTIWRLSRCNPLGGSGFDPPRWFDEPKPPPF